MDIITLNLPHGSGTVDFAAMVKICLGISLFFTYPMMMFPVTHLLDKTFSLTTAPYRGNIMRLILVGMTGLVVNAVPNFAILMSLIGATCCTLLAFILPATFHLSIFRQRLPKRQRYFDIMLIVLGVIGSVVGLWDAFDRMSEGHEALLEVNEFSSVKNGSLHAGHAASSPVSGLETFPNIVLPNISVSENINKSNKAGNIAQEDIQINPLQDGTNLVKAMMAVPTDVIEVKLPEKSGSVMTKDISEPSSTSGSLSEIGSNAANADGSLGTIGSNADGSLGTIGSNADGSLGTIGSNADGSLGTIGSNAANADGSLGTIGSNAANADVSLGTNSKGTSVPKSLKDESIDHLEKTVSSQKAADESSHTKQIAPGTLQNTIPRGSKT